MTQLRIIVIAGTDSSGGAGLTRDTSAARDLGVEVAPVITAVTAQTHAGLMGMMPVPANLVRQQIDAACASGPVHGIKVGMLASRSIAECVAERLSQIHAPLVIDPVLKSSSGANLIDAGLPGHLLAQAKLLTPNLPEAATLTGLPVAKTEQALSDQAAALMSLGVHAVLIKGGHADGKLSTDHLFGSFGHQEYNAPRLDIKMRGTGCTLATSITCALAKGHSIIQACSEAKSYLSHWLQNATNDRSDTIHSC